MADRTARNFLLVTATRIALWSLWFLAIIIICRQLGKTGVGIYTICEAIIKIMWSCLGNPLDLAVLRRVPIYLRSDRPRALNIIRSAFLARIAFGGAAFAGILLLSDHLSLWFMAGIDPGTLFILTGFGVIGDLLSRSVLNYFQATEAFGRYVLIETVVQVGRFVLIVTLACTDNLTVQTAVGSYVVMAYVGFLFGICLLPRDIFGKSLAHRADIIEILHFSKWIISGMVIAALYERMDVLMLGRFWTPDEVGIYATAFKLAMLPELLVWCLSTIFYPRVVDLYRTDKFISWVKNYLKLALPLGAIAVTASLLLGDIAITIIFDGEFPESVQPFYLLVIGMFVWLVLAPLPMALLALVAPKKIVAITSFQLVLMFAGGVLLIGQFGFMGAAILIMSVRILIGFVIFILAWKVAKTKSLVNIDETPVQTVNSVMDRENTELEQEH